VIKIISKIPLVISTAFLVVGILQFLLSIWLQSDTLHIIAWVSICTANIISANNINKY